MQSKGRVLVSGQSVIVVTQESGNGAATTGACSCRASIAMLSQHDMSRT